MLLKRVPTTPLVDDKKYLKINKEINYFLRTPPPPSTTLDIKKNSKLHIAKNNYSNYFLHIFLKIYMHK